MYADHVPLAEAMETLAVNVDVPPPLDGDDNARSRRQRPPGADGQPGNNPTNGTPVAQGGPGGAPPPAGAPGGGPRGQGGPGGPGGRGGFNRAQWNLAFFAGPTKSQVQQEIREFQSGDPDDDNKVYAYGVQMQMISNDTVTSIPDPRLQSWPGVKPPDPTAAPAVAAAAPTPTQPDGNAPDPVPAGPPTVHTYFDALAAGANIWIMAPGSWTPPVANAPPANSSIISAVKKLVSGSHGYVTQAIVLRAGRGGARGNTVANDNAWEDRMRNAINGLPPDERPEAIDQLNKEVDFRKSLAALPPDQRRKKMFEHFAERMLYGERLSRLSPIKRAQIYKRMVAMRSPDKVAQ
jgi:hypothetical protein